MLGYKYWGCELDAAQIERNQYRKNEYTCGRYIPKWIRGDAAKILDDAPAADFIFSCPPYGDLEKYSDHPADLSSMGPAEFDAAYATIIRKACAVLRQDSFACIVVGSYRDKKTGLLNDLAANTAAKFAAAGLSLYNKAVLVTSFGSGGARTNGTFGRGHRKLVNVHQEVLVFVKGSPEKAAAKCEQLYEAKTKRKQPPPNQNLQSARQMGGLTYIKLLSTKHSMESAERKSL